MTSLVTVFERRVSQLRNRTFFISDVLLLAGCVAISFGVTYEGDWSTDLEAAFRFFLVASVPLKVATLTAVGLYRRLWRYASVSDLEVLMLGAALCGGIDVVVGLAILPSLAPTTVRLSSAVIVLAACLGAMAITLPRLTVRIFARRDRWMHRKPFRRAVIVGAGAAGGMIVRELLENSQLGIVPVALLDDDPTKHGLRLHNVPVRGPVHALEQVASDNGASEVVIAMPSASGRRVRDVVRHATAAGLTTRTVPGLYEILSGEKRVDALRQIEIQDLLRREPIETDIAKVASLVTGKVVMVTGAGGSIGSELCRQLARLEPSRIVALGRGENSIFELLQEFSRTFPHVRIDPVIADIRDHARLERIVRAHRPHSVFHAAAHKHVPLMEAHVSEAVLNNVLGTRNVVSVCSEHDVSHLVLISTDKAVRPTSVMGATKRIAEHIVHQGALKGRRGYVSVRFGNVLGSRGSVVPTFMRQIADGGPVTITHPDMTRYFMTIPEAVQLVLQAGAMGDEGEVFVLDMGEPVRVFDLATDLIRLSGLELDHDIEVRFTGMRPGEKLYEELFFTGADISPTEHPKILRARDAESADDNVKDIDSLIFAAQQNRPEEEIRELILALVPEYAGALEQGELGLHSVTGSSDQPRSLKVGRTRTSGDTEVRRGNVADERTPRARPPLAAEGR